MVNPNFANEIVKNYRTQQERDNYTALFVQERANARDLGPGSDQFIQQMKAHEERQKALDEKFSQVMGTLNQPLPQPVNPQIDTGHLIALGLSALLGGGNQLPQNINYAQGQAHENAKALDQRNLQQFQLNKEDQLRLLQFLQQQLLDEQNFGQSLTRDQIQQDFQSRIQDKATRDRIDAQEWAQFYNANDPGEATVAGKKLLQKGLITKEEFDMKVKAAGEAAQKAEVKAYFDQIQSVRKSDGSIPDELVPAFKEAEASLRAKYPGVFIPPVPTTETLAAQKLKADQADKAERQKLAREKYEWGKTNLTAYQKQSLANAAYYMGLAERKFQEGNYMDAQQLQRMAQNALPKDAMPALQKDRAQTMNAIAQMEAKLKSLQGSPEAAKMDSILGKLGLHRKKDSKVETAMAELAKLRTKLTQIDETIAQLEAQPIQEQATPQGWQDPGPGYRVKTEGSPEYDQDMNDRQRQSMSEQELKNSGGYIGAKSPEGLMNRLNEFLGKHPKQTPSGNVGRGAPKKSTAMSEAQLRKEAQRAIAAGADKAKVAERFKKLTGKNL